MNGLLLCQWKVAMQQKYISLLENDTFTPVEHARSMHINCKWVYKMKTNPDSILRYKARLVIKGYEQMQGIDFDVTYTPVSKMTSLHYLMSCAAQEDWEMDQLNIVTAFLNPAIDKEVYMQLPEGIERLIAELLSLSCSSTPDDSTHKSTHNPCAKANLVSRVKDRFIETTQTPDGNSQRVSTMPGNSQGVSTMPGNSQGMSTMPSNSQRVNMMSGNSQRVSTMPSNSQRVSTMSGN